MKSLLTAVIFVLATQYAATAQKNIATFKPILIAYYDVKNALVNTDAAKAALVASQFVKVINGIDTKTLPAAELKSFIAVQNKLQQAAANIAATKDINKQRDLFAGFSIDMYALAKDVKLSDQPVYQDYCPMKKMYWLSNEKNIKNPYYGNAMLTCGSITATINP
ncbi:DUF3347 domain-containing protein [Ferruginibacter profundus]